jgi:NnrU protein
MPHMREVVGSSPTATTIRLPQNAPLKLEVERGSVASLFLAALFFDANHFFISGTELRGKIVGLIGERRYQGLFSLMSLIGIVWLSRAYGQAEYF